MKVLRHLFSAMFVFVLFAASIAAQQTGAAKKNYENIKVEKFTIQEGVKFPESSLDVMMAEIVAELKKLGKFKDVSMKVADSAPPEKSENGAAVETKTPESTIALSGTITKYKPGSRTARYLVGFGAGMTKVKARIKFVDTASGDVLFDKEIDGKVIIGFFGGNSNDATRGFAREVAGIAKKNFLPK